MRQYLESVLVLEGEIEEHEPYVDAASHLEGRSEILGVNDLHAQGLEAECNESGDLRRVVDEQYLPHSGDRSTVSTFLMRAIGENGFVK